MVMRRLILYMAVSVVWLQTVVQTEDDTVKDSCFYKDSGEWSECSSDTHVQTLKQVFIVGEFSCPTSKFKTRACSISGVESTTAGNDKAFEQLPQTDLNLAKENSEKGKGDLGEGQENIDGVEQLQVEDYGGGEGQGNNNGVEQPQVGGQDVGEGKTEGVRGAGGHEGRTTPYGSQWGGERSQLKTNGGPWQWRNDYSGGGGRVDPDRRHGGWQGQRGPHHPTQGQWGSPHPPQGQWAPPHPPHGPWGPPRHPHGPWGPPHHPHGPWGPPHHPHGPRGRHWRGQGYGYGKWGPGRRLKNFLREQTMQQMEGQTKQQMKQLMKKQMDGQMKQQMKKQMEGQMKKQVMRQSKMWNGPVGVK